MFDIGFSELVLIFIVGLVVLGPQRLPVAIRTVVSWIRTLRGIASNVQNELAQELKLQELQESIKKAEHLNLSALSPELSKTIEELKSSAQKMQNEIKQQNSEIAQSVRENLATEPKPANTNEEEILPENDVDKAVSSELSADEIAELAEADEEQLILEEYDPLADPPTTQNEKNNTSAS